MLESSKGVSSVIMASWLGISQKSAWKICHALRLLLSQRHDFGQLLSGTVELDDKFFGGAPRFKKGVKHKRGKGTRSEEHTSELQSLMRISYAVFGLKKKI